MNRLSAVLGGTLVQLLLLSSLSHSKQSMSNLERDRAQAILQTIANDVSKHYYDPNFHGVDWKARVAEAKQKISSANSFNMSMSYIAAALDSLDDSHTFLMPPQHAYRIDYGFQYQIVGTHCFVTRVRPGSDAEKVGLKPGDEILGIDNWRVSRDNLWKLQYVFSVLRPQGSLRLALQDLSGAQRQLDVPTKVKMGKKQLNLGGLSQDGDIWDIINQEETYEHLMRARYAEYGNQLIALQVPEFAFSEDEVYDMLKKARNFPNLIVDLRGNPGGSVNTLKYLVGAMFDKDVKLADRVGRKEAKPEIAKALHDPYMGKVVVLVDAKSASAAELFARVIQLEKRGTVVGDLTSGSVMESRRYQEQLGADTVIFYGASITEWDLKMSDGKSLEHVGVTPDDVVLPTAQDLAAGRDPVLAHAAQALGVRISPDAAGKAFPYEWPPAE